MQTLEAMAATARSSDVEAATPLAAEVQTSAQAAQVALVPVELSDFEMAILTNLNWQFQTAQVVAGNSAPGELPPDALAALHAGMVGSRQTADVMRAVNAVAADGAAFCTK